MIDIFCSDFITDDLFLHLIIYYIFAQGRYVPWRVGRSGSLPLDGIHLSRKLQLFTFDLEALEKYIFMNSYWNMLNSYVCCILNG